jgi:hypothetical protein
VPAYVQYAQVEAIANGPSQSLAFSTNTTPGNLIAVVWANQGNAYTGTPTFTDTQSNPYTQCASIVDNVTENTQMFMAYAPTIVGGSCTVTATYVTGISNGALYIFELSGCNNFDNGAAATGTSTLAATGNFTTSYSDIIVAATINYGSASGAGTGYTLIVNTPSYNDILEYAVVASGTQNATANLSGSQGYGIIASGFYQSGGPVSPAGFLGSVYVRKMG